ncbi:MAG: hypothetical protein N3I35_08870 [Clostridia bacterium]|nr:hypothetical protein [Clostridia bacterium]
MQNKTVFLAIIAIFAYSAFRVWQGIQDEGQSFLRMLSLTMLLAGIALLIVSRMKAFMRKINRDYKNKGTR